MSDGDLVARLRDLGDRAEYMPHMHHVAADRIEELEAKLATCEKYRDAYDKMGRIGTEAYRDLEAKLAKAVEFAEIVERCGHGALWDLARTTLAELKGEPDA